MPTLTVDAVPVAATARALLSLQEASLYHAGTQEPPYHPGMGCVGGRAQAIKFFCSDFENEVLVFRPVLSVCPVAPGHSVR